MRVFSFSNFGYEGALVEVEVDLRRGIPVVDIVGLADGSVKESRERVISAFKNSNLDFPSERVLICLSPADLKKEGASFDLAIALAILNEQDESLKNTDCSLLVMGELELSGNIRAVRGMYASVKTALANGIDYIVCNSTNECEVTEGKVIQVETLLDAYKKIKNLEYKDMKTECPSNEIEFPKMDEDFNTENLKGFSKGLRALEIAIAGKHNILTYGAPGCGKTLLLQKAKYLTPLLTNEESQTVTRIHSLAGLTSPSRAFIKQPPFRMPHQTASIEGICGGGVNCRPGEISLAHNGILFLDEAAEFRSSVLQMLRVPLESRSITLSRAGRTTVYPANFQLMLATNPCPCGNYGVENKICICSARSVEMYWKKFSGPLLDRIEIRMQIKKDFTDEEPVNIEQIKEHIKNAFEVQRARGFYNGKATPCNIAEFQFTKDATDLLEKTEEKYDFSPRRVANIQKLARTIADIEKRDVIELKDMTEAINLCSDTPLLNF